MSASPVPSATPRFGFLTPRLALLSLAQALYEKYGFANVGVRKRYYTDNNEDALIMTTDPLDSGPMRQRMAEMAERYGPRPDVPHAGGTGA